MRPAAKRVKINLSTFDFIKGLGMLTVIATHMLQYYNLREYPMSDLLYNWLAISSGTILPMFVCISGFSFKPKDVKTTLKKTFSELVVPYLWVMAFLVVLFPLTQYPHLKHWPTVWLENLRYFLAFVFGLPENGIQMFGISLYLAPVVWFLLALFMALNIMNVILKVKKEWIQILLVIGCQFVGMYMGAVGFNYFCIGKGFLAVIYCYTGYLLKKHNFFGRVNIHVAGLIGLLCGGLCLLQMKLGLVSLTCTVASCLFLPLIGAYVGRFDLPVMNQIKQVGTYSYWIMCIHSVEITIFPWPRWGQYMAHNPLLAFAVDAAIKAVILIAGCILLKKYTKFKYMRRKAVHGK